MPKPLARPPPRSRYSYERVVDEIAHRIAMLPRGTTARLARELGLETHQFSHRLRGVKAKFSPEQIGAISDFIVPGGAPVAWPWYPWAVCELFGRANSAQIEPRPARAAKQASKGARKNGVPATRKRR
jgi:hypothetical protein